MPAFRRPFEFALKCHDALRTLYYFELAHNPLEDRFQCRGYALVKIRRKNTRDCGRG
ncbi:hypothetical protein CUJ84_Chr004720 [Rhizobium leguminosarum]|uniref:Uncharacterized protein n=1 Tax=Rhizobium leguminosarum TaxID=384 RepID=A0A2K9Z9X5_RHILE|nr:hypothetical protein CUJ84_Chr004720 [Rhizobium leguminosarum]